MTATISRRLTALEKRLGDSDAGPGPLVVIFVHPDERDVDAIRRRGLNPDEPGNRMLVRFVRPMGAQDVRH